MRLSLYAPNQGLMANITPWVLLLSLATAQSPDSGRNCSTNDTTINPNGISYRILNATGSFDVKGFRDPGSDAPEKSWTWSIGIQNVWNFTNNRTFWYEQPIWLDTHGTDLAADDLGYEMCFMSQLDQSQSLQKRGHGDNGDCTKFFNQKCVDDWEKALTNQALEYIRTNATNSPCKVLQTFTPDSCKDFKRGSSVSGLIPPRKRTCPYGLGSPDYDGVYRTASFAYDAARKNDTKDFKTYDEITTSTIPVFAVAWSKSTSPMTTRWSQARVMCLSTPNITEGSRKPSGVPSSSSTIRVDIFVLVSSLMVLALL